MSEKVIIFGAGSSGKKLFERIRNDKTVICFTDNNPMLWGTFIFGIPVISPTDAIEKSYERIYVSSLPGMYEISEQLIRMGVDPKMTDTNYVSMTVLARERFLFRFAEEIYLQRIDGQTAEAGVYRGEFAKEINKNFPDRKLYLFDTYMGFVSEDVEIDKAIKQTDEMYEKNLSNTSIELVMSKMTHPENCVIREGRFPQTAENIDERFCFVNLDMDLYMPTLEGLRFFTPKMNAGGVILIHDYFNPGYPNIKKAVDDFQAENNERLRKVPIGDDISIAILF